MPGTDESLSQRITALLRRDLKLGDDRHIPDDMPLFGGELDLDSLDALLLVGSLEKEFGIKIPNEDVGQRVFADVRTLTAYLAAQGIGASGLETVAAAPKSVDLQAHLANLPHGEAFRFVTGLTRVEPGVSAEAVWSVKGSEPFFAGHFPGNPIVPGVLLSEALAQTSGLVMAGAGQKAIQGRLAHVEMRFNQSVAPPAEITLRSRHDKTLGDLHRFQVQALCKGEVVAEGVISLAMG